MYAEERRQALLELARREGRVSVTEAAEEFHVATETIRRDLEALDRTNSLRRVHGGAVPVERLNLGDVNLPERDLVAVAEKQRIARRAIALLPKSGSGDVILDAGSTTYRVAAELPRGDWTVFTNSLPIAGLLAQRDDVRVHLLGGRVRGVTQSCVGVRPVAELAGISADLTLLGTNGISDPLGFSTPDPDEAAVKAAMAAAGRRVVVVADARKVGAEATARFAGLDQINVLVTDDGVDKSDIEVLLQHGIEVLIA